jgi:hypothetical protein
VRGSDSAVTVVANLQRAATLCGKESPEGCDTVWEGERQAEVRCGVSLACWLSALKVAADRLCWYVFVCYV